MKLLTTENNNITDDLEVTLTIIDYNQKPTPRLDVDHIRKLIGLQLKKKKMIHAQYASEITRMEPIYALSLAVTLSISATLINGFVQI